MYLSSNLEVAALIQQSEVMSDDDDLARMFDSTPHLFA